MVPACSVLWIVLCLAAQPCTSFTNFGSFGIVRRVPLSESFSDYKEIPDWLLANCEKMGFKEPTPVQSMALPSIFAGKDVVLQAHTGSGKTLAFGLPIIARIDASRAAIQAVVVVPTRELGLQVTTVLKQLASGAPDRVMIMSVVEGSKNRRQQLWATAEPPHIVVGNPRSLQRLVDLGRLRLNAVTYVVLDEVDACLIEPDTRLELHTLLSRHLSTTYQDADDAAADDPMRESRVYRDLAKNVAGVGPMAKYRLSRQTIMCSATIPQRQHFASTCFQKGWTATLPELVMPSKDALVPSQVVHCHIPCETELRVACMAYLLRSKLKAALVRCAEEGEVKGVEGVEGVKVEVAEEEEETEATAEPLFQAIIFVDAKNEADIAKYVDTAQAALLKTLSAAGSLEVPVVGALLESMDIDERGRVLERYRQASCGALVCSDLAARGLDIPNTSLVVQMSLPSRVEDYLHRAGRTGRMNRAGTVVTLTHAEEQFVLDRFSNELGVPISLRRLKLKT